MNLKRVLQLCAPLAIVAGGALVSAQQQLLLPSAPQREFGGSVAPVYEGWWDNPDGTKTAMFGYYSRNSVQELDVPVGANNRFEPGDADRGQPTHFLTRRKYGMFTVSLPKDFGRGQKLIWVLNTAGYSGSAHVNLAPDFNLTPNKSSEESPDRSFNLPPVLRFGPTDPTFTMPMASLARVVKRTASVGTPFTLDVVAEDDARYSSGTNAPMTRPRPPVTLHVTKYRGTGNVVISEPRPTVVATRGGKAFEPFSGKATTSVTFSDPGEYMLHVTANDYSDDGGGGSGCCWTTALVSVSVGGGSARTTGQ
jgi:streptolysin S family bacteriocin protoxin